MKRKWWNIFTKKNYKNIQDSHKGYDFKSKRFVNMHTKGILDAFKVERIALETAISVASNFGDIEVVCAEFPEKQA